MSLDRGRRIGRYEILSSIGAGGMSEVYRARDHTLNRDVALKVLRGANATSGSARFEREAKAVAALAHPNVITLYDFGVDDGVAYLTMEPLEGETLRAALNEPMPTEKAVCIAVAIAEALRSAHARGIVHRDLKPENVFVTREGTVKVLDFGLAHGCGAASPGDDTATAPGTVMGTAAYMSPEQIRGENVTPASDLFALGCVLYELLAGRHPFRHESPAETMAAILRDDPPDLRSRSPLQLPEPVIRVVEHALDKRPEARFQNAADFIYALNAAVEGSGSLMTAPDAQTARSLAVLPFESSTSDPSVAYLTQALTERVINGLAPVRGVNVLSRNAVFSYRPESSDPRRIGLHLGVDAIVTGRVMRRGDWFIVGVELTDTRDGHQLWGERYERRASDAAQIERPLAQRIAGALQRRLGAGAPARRLRKPAYRLYFRSRYEWKKRDLRRSG